MPAPQPTKRPPGRPRTQPCGTEAGYQRHRRADEQCPGCKTAHKRYNADRKRKNARRAA